MHFKVPGIHFRMRTWKSWFISRNALLVLAIPKYFVLEVHSGRKISLINNIVNDWRLMRRYICPSKVNNINDRLNLICLLGRHLVFTKLFNYGKQSSSRHHSCLYPIIVKKPNFFLLLTNLCRWLVHDFYNLCLNLWVNKCLFMEYHIDFSNV